MGNNTEVFYVKENSKEFDNVTAAWSVRANVYVDSNSDEHINNWGSQEITVKSFATRYQAICFCDRMNQIWNQHAGVFVEPEMERI